MLLSLLRSSGRLQSASLHWGSMSEPNAPYWVLLFNDFIAETEPSEMQRRLGTVEEAIFFRLQELEHAATGQNERVALKMAVDKLLEIKISKLGFPPSPIP